MTRFELRNQNSPIFLTALKNYVSHTLLTLGFWPLFGPVWAWGEGLSFDRDIRPILSENCFHCHGPDEKERKAKLRLDTKEGILADMGGYFAVKPGDPQESELFARIASHDPDEQMPPPDSNRNLSPKEITLLKEWIAGGAKWTDHWTFQPIVRQNTNYDPVSPTATDNICFNF